MVAATAAVKNPRKSSGAALNTTTSTNGSFISTAANQGSSSLNTSSIIVSPPTIGVQTRSMTAALKTQVLRELVKD